MNPETGGTGQSELVRASLHPHVAVRCIENVNIASHNVQSHSHGALVVSKRPLTRTLAALVMILGLTIVLVAKEDRAS